MTELLQNNHFWVGLAFLVLVIALIALKVPAAAAKALDARGAKIQAQLDEATRIRQEAETLLAQIKTQLAERETHTGGVVNKTDVLRLDAQLLGIEELPDVYMASVEFSGMIREDVSAGPSPFREVWNMTKPRNGGGWLVAGVQALQ